MTNSIYGDGLPSILSKGKIWTAGTIRRSSWIKTTWKSSDNCSEYRNGKWQHTHKSSWSSINSKLGKDLHKYPALTFLESLSNKKFFIALRRVFPSSSASWKFFQIFQIQWLEFCFACETCKIIGVFSLEFQDFIIWCQVLFTAVCFQTPHK